LQLFSLNTLIGSSFCCFNLGQYHLRSGAFSLYALLACFDLKGCIAFASNFQDSLDLNVKEPFELHQPSGLPVLQMQLEQRTRRGGRVRSQGVG